MKKKKVNIILWAELCDIMHSIQLLGATDSMPDNAVDELEKSSEALSRACDILRKTK